MAEAENILGKKWDECGDVGLTQKTIQALQGADIHTLDDFIMCDVAGMAELRAAELTLGQANRLKLLVQNNGVAGSKLDGTAPGRQQSGGSQNASGVRTTRSNADSVKKLLEQGVDNSDNVDMGGGLDTLLDNMNIKDVRHHPELDESGKLWEFLKDSQYHDPLLSGVPGGGSTNKTGYAMPSVPHDNFTKDDPRAILIMRATSNKTVHITTFLSEETKKRLRNKRQQYLVQNGEALTMKIKDEHPYAGISILEYGAANMRLMNYLLRMGRLDRDKVEYYMAYTTLIYELGDKYEWRDVLNFDFQYRERQEEIGFEWGAMVSVMELQLFAGNKHRNVLPIDKSRYNPRGGRPKTEICRNFANTGVCNYGESCRFRHVDASSGRVGPPRGALQPGSGTLLQQPPLTTPTSRQQYTPTQH